MNKTRGKINLKHQFDFKTTMGVDKTGMRPYYGVGDLCTRRQIPQAIGFIISLIIIWIFLIFKVKDKKTILRHLIYLIVMGVISLLIVLSAPGKRVIGERAASSLSIQKSGASSSQRF